MTEILKAPTHTARRSSRYSAPQPTSMPAWQSSGHGSTSRKKEVPGGLGFRDWGLGFRVRLQSSGFGVKVLGFRESAILCGQLLHSGFVLPWGEAEEVAEACPWQEKRDEAGMHQRIHDCDDGVKARTTKAVILPEPAIAPPRHHKILSPGRERESHKEESL